MDFLTGFACILPLLIPVGIGFAIWMGLRKGKQGKAKVADLAQVLDDAGFAKADVVPWYTTQIGEKQVWVKAAATATYKVIGNSPNSLNLGSRLVCLVPVRHLPIGGMVHPAHGHHEDADFETAFVSVGMDGSTLSQAAKLALMGALGVGAPHVELGDYDNTHLYAPDGVFTGGLLLRSASQSAEPAEIQAWLTETVALAKRMES